MFKIIKDSEVIADQAALQWVKRQENGVFVRCTAEEGQGILVNDTIYTVRGKPAVEGYDVVDVVQVQAAAGGNDRTKEMEDQLAAIYGAVERGLA